MRISNPAANLNEEVRIENEVAAIVLMRNALSEYGSMIVPDVYGWSSGRDAPGFIIEEKMTGGPLLDMTLLPADAQKEVLLQAAKIFKLIQDYRTLPSMNGYGGLNFNEEGNVVMGPTSIHCGGPFLDYADMYRGLFGNRWKWLAHVLKFQTEKVRVYRDALKDSFNLIKLRRLSEVWRGGKADIGTWRLQ